MSQIGNIIRVALIGAISVALPLSSTSAQEITQSHMTAALDAVSRTAGARSFDNVLPNLALSVENRLIRLRPDLHKVITATADGAALKLVVRRKDLDIDVARIWAKSFTEQELVAIAAFLKSPAGQKYQDLGPKVVSETYQAVQQWSDRVGEELLDKTRQELKKQGYDFGG